MRLLILLGSFFVVGLHADDEPVAAEKPEQKAIERKCIDMLASVAPISPKQPRQATIMSFPDGRAVWGLLFDKTEITALVSFHRATTDVFDYPPNWLSLLVWQEGRWRYRQFLGSASSFDIHRRDDLGLQIVQGYCQTERHGGKQSSWRYDAKARRLVPTGLDDWGPYAIKGDYICYRRGHERLAHWETTWVYRFMDGKRGELIASLHQDDQGRFSVSFLDEKAVKIRTWAFATESGNESRAMVFAANDPTDLQGEQIALLELPGHATIAPESCFELLTGLSAELLTDDWTAKVGKPHVARTAIHATGDTEVVRVFEWPQPTKKNTR